MLTLDTISPNFLRKVNLWQMTQRCNADSEGLAMDSKDRPMRTYSLSRHKPMKGRA